MYLNDCAIFTLNKIISKNAYQDILYFGTGFTDYVQFCISGAAFTEGLSSGLSTSVAVFCHELPHELGKTLSIITVLFDFRIGLDEMDNIYITIYFSFSRYDIIPKSLFKIKASLKLPRTPTTDAYTYKLMKKLFWQVYETTSY